MSFESLGLSDALLRAVAEEGYSAPTPIQLQAIPAVLAGRDLLAGSQTGTGKTAGFVLPILQRLVAAGAGQRGKRPIRALVLAPTRELAAQVEASVRAYGKHLPLTSGVIFGGVNIKPQYEMLERGVDLLVATPGRLLDHHGQRTIDLSKVEVLVLDEADRMLDMGFIHDIRKVLAILPKQRQNLLFSATYSDEIRALVATLLKDPVQIQVTPRNTTVEAVAQRVLDVDAKRKPELLVHLIKEHSWFQVLVFTRTKHGANRLAAQLEKNGVTALPIHGNKSQNARTRALAAFKSGELQALVATDIAARGLDIEQLPHVVNFDLPNVPEDYVHRIGRTGRAGATGEALSLVARDELPLLRDIERLIRRSFKREQVAGFEPGTAPSASFKDAQAGRDLQPQRPARRDGAGPSGHAAARGHNGQKRTTRSQPGVSPTTVHSAGSPRSNPARNPGQAAGRSDTRSPGSTRPQRPGQRLGHDQRGGTVRSNLPPGWK